MEIFTSSASPTAASQAANTRIIIGMESKMLEFEFKIDVEIITNRDNIIPSKHNKVDIRCDRNMKVPKSDSINARTKLNKVGVMIGNYDFYHSLMSRNH